MILVEQSIYDDFVSAFTEKAGQLKVGDPLLERRDADGLADLEGTPGARALLGVEGAREERAASRARRRAGRARVLSGHRRRGGRGSLDDRAGGLHPRRHDHPRSRGREGRDQDRERRPLRADNGVGLDRRRRVGTASPRGIKAGTVRISMPIPPSGLPFSGYKQSGFGRELMGSRRSSLYLGTKSVTVNAGAPDQPLRALGLPPR